MYYQRIQYTTSNYALKAPRAGLVEGMLFFGPASAWSPAKYAYEVDKGEKNGKHKIWIATDKTRMELDQMR